MASRVHVEIPELDGEVSNVLTLEIARADVPALTDEATLRLNVYLVPWRTDGAEWIVVTPTGPGTPVKVEIPDLEGVASTVLTIEVARTALPTLVDEANLSIQPTLGASLVLLHEPAP